MLAATAVLLVIGSLIFTLLVRAKDLPPPEPVSPSRHLEERRATIYENLRDLQFEYRVGKLSEGDYQQTKLGLQQELASVLAEIDRVAGKPEAAAKAKGKPEGYATVGKPEAYPTVGKPEAYPTVGKPEAYPTVGKPEAYPTSVCPHCGAQFDRPLKFCGECGKPMGGGKP